MHSLDEIAPKKEAQGERKICTGRMSILSRGDMPTRNAVLEAGKCKE